MYYLEKLINLISPVMSGDYSDKCNPLGFCYTMINGQSKSLLQHTIGSAGYDLHSNEKGSILPGKVLLIGTGYKVSVPQGYESQIRSRSGIAFNHEVVVFNSPATIDSDYTGEIKIILKNMSNKVFYINKGDRIAQLIISECYCNPLKFVDEIHDETERGSNGFGSTGK